MLRPIILSIMALVLSSLAFDAEASSGSIGGSLAAGAARGSRGGGSSTDTAAPPAGQFTPNPGRTSTPTYRGRTGKIDPATGKIEPSTGRVEPQTGKIEPSGGTGSDTPQTGNSAVGGTEPGRDDGKASGTMSTGPGQPADVGGSGGTRTDSSTGTGEAPAVGADESGR